MDTYPRKLYLDGHETSRHSPELGAASAPSDPPVEGRNTVSRRCQTGWRIPQFGCALATVIPPPRQTRTAGQTITWPTAPTEPAAEGGPGPTPSGGPDGIGIHYQPLDITPNQGCHPSEIRHQLYYSQCLETHARHGLELPKAQQTRPGTERKGYSVLEASCVAPHKKKPYYLEPTWGSLTRRASCLSQRFPGHGLHGGKPRFSPPQAIGPRSQLSLSLPSRPERIAWGCTVDFTRTRTFAHRKSSSSCGTCFAISEGTWFFFGTVDSRTEHNVSHTSFGSILDSMFIFSRPMLRNSTPMNLSGTT